MAFGPHHQRGYKLGVVPSIILALLSCLTLTFFARPLRSQFAYADRVNKHASKTTQTQKPSAPSKPWHTFDIKKGDSLYRYFKRLKIGMPQLYAIIHLPLAQKTLTHLQPGGKILIQLDGEHQLSKLHYAIDPKTTLEITQKGGDFTAKIAQHRVNTETQHSAGTINASFTKAAKKAGLPNTVAMELVKIFGWEIDFARDIRQGDHFNVIYQTQFVDGKKIGNGPVIAAEITTRGKPHTAIRYVDATGQANYYTPRGKNLKKTFIRYPLPHPRITSSFSRHRWHPVLHRFRAHLGVDLGAHRGTPVHATSDGRVVYRGRDGGYGNTLIIRSGIQYTTLYAHLGHYARGLHKGSHVKQGQTIAYVGSTGLATGPHLHYEVRRFGIHQNPVTIKLPRAKALANKYRDAFKALSQQRLAELHPPQIQSVVVLAGKQ